MCERGQSFRCEWLYGEQKRRFPFPRSGSIDAIRPWSYRHPMSTALPAEARPGKSTDGIPARLASIDIIRGAVMVLMAIDHVRVYSGLPPGGPTPGIFFTRWITHF